MSAVYAGCLYAVGYLTGVAAFAYAARRRGLSTEGIWALVVAALVGGLGGARIAQFLATDGLGKSLLGAVCGGYLSVIYVKRRLGITRPTGDLFAYGLSAGEAIGRLGCFVGGCCYGKTAEVPWAVHQHGAWRHPTQLYLAAAAAATFGVVRVLDSRTLPENALFFLQGLLMCSFRFAVEFYRDGAPAIGALTDAQWACVAGMLFFGYKLIRLMQAAGVRSSIPAATAASR